MTYDDIKELEGFFSSEYPSSYIMLLSKHHYWNFLKGSKESWSNYQKRPTSHPKHRGIEISRDSKLLLPLHFAKGIELE